MKLAKIAMICLAEVVSCLLLLPLLLSLSATLSLTSHSLRSAVYKEQSLLARKGSGRELRRRKGTALRAAEAEAKAASREREAEVATSDRWPPVGGDRESKLIEPRRVSQSDPDRT